MAPSIVASIHSALYHLDSQIEGNNHTVELKLSSGILMHKLRVVKTFLVCSGNNMGNILTRVEDIVSRILEIKVYVSLEVHVVSWFNKMLAFLVDIESLEEEMHTWYTSLLVSSSREANQVVDIFGSVLENLDGFLSFPRASYVELLSQPIESLKQNIAFLRNFVRFDALLHAEHKEFLDFLSQIEGFAICAAHLTLHLFSAGHYNFKALTGDVQKPMVSELLLKIKLVDDPHLLEACARALESIKNSRELYVPTIDLKDFITFLLSALWEMLQLDTGLVVSLKDKLQALYEGVRCLRAIFKEQPSKFDGKIRDITGAAIFDAGIMILSLHQNDFAIDLGLGEFLEKVRLVRREVHEDQMVNVSSFSYPKTTALGFLDFLLDYLTEVNSYEVEAHALSCALKIREDLVFLRLVIGKLLELRNEQKDLHQALWDLAMEVAYKLEFLIDQLVLGNIQDSFSTSFQSITEDIMILQTDSMKIFDEKIPHTKETTWMPFQSDTRLDDDVVGFENERSSIINRLMRGSKKLQVVAIVGMPGLGKTTLATKVFSVSSLAHHFHVRAWCIISQVLNKRKVLLDLLSQIISKLPDEYMKMDEDDLAQALRRSLKGRRYLILLDDVWDIQAFHCLKDSFPDDLTESRILLTSRHCDVATLDEMPLFLPQLTSEESLELLQKKLFPSRKDWPSVLHDFGMEVAEYCNGLPLTVVLVAGLLRSTGQEVWKEVLESLRSGIISNADECKSTVELSYKYLPDHLKPCFLSFATLREDQEISVKKLIWLWIAEGFVRKSESKLLEEVATDYLNSLIGRSLVMNAKERSRGGIQACRVHDLLHDFCLRKADEESFLHVFKRLEEFSFDEPWNIRRFCIDCEPEQFIESRLLAPRLRSLSFLSPTERGDKVDMLFIGRVFKLLRVLALEHVKLNAFPWGQGFLVQLRYLTIKGVSYVSPCIGNLSNLETFIVYQESEICVTLPDTFWNLRKLRHLYGNKSDQFGNYGFILPASNPDSSGNLPELDSLSSLDSRNWDIMEKQLRKFPRIRQLRSWLRQYGEDPLNGSKIMSFSFLSQLESLNLSFDILSNDFELIFPENFKKLTLSWCGLPWRMISGIAGLPNLEVLKLLKGSFEGDSWHVEEGEFPKLKFLKLDWLNVIKWTASEDQFPNLEKLVVEKCWRLEEIPECMENVLTLKMIEVKGCSDHVASLVKNVEEYQKDYGNSDLKVLIH